LGMSLEVLELTEAPHRQLTLNAIGNSHPEGALPVVLAELAAEVGEKKLGVLRILNSHRPELRSGLFPALNPTARLQPKTQSARNKSRTTHESQLWLAEQARFAELVVAPTRLLNQPLEIVTALEKGATFALGQELFTIERLQFEQRLEAVEWWASAAIQRDYVRVWLRNPGGLIEALAYVDRRTRKRYIQSIMD
jgi:hypothetical protein